MEFHVQFSDKIEPFRPHTFQKKCIKINRNLNFIFVVRLRHHMEG